MNYRDELPDIWCPFYHKDSGRVIFCEGITDDSVIHLSFGSMEAKRK